MDKNDFDIDYDFKKELGFDPDEFLGSDPGEDLDLSEYQDIDLDSLTEDDLDLSKYGITEDYGQQPSQPQQEPAPQAPEAGDFDDFDLDNPVPRHTGERQPIAFDDVDLLRREKTPEDQEPQQWDSPENPEEGYDPQDYGMEDIQADEGYDGEDYDQEGYDDQPYDEEGYDEEAYGEEDYDQENSRQQEEEAARPEKKKFFARKEKKEKKEKPPKEIKIKQSTGPSFFQKFITLYFGAAIAELSGMNQEPQGRRKRSKYRIFKEAYLPPIILIATVLIVLTCIIGSASTLVQRKLVHDENNRKESIAASEEEDRLQQEYVHLMDQADLAAQAYDYDKAIEILDTYAGTPPQDMVTKRAEFAQMATKMKEWKDPAGIPNLSFHALVADPARAYADKDLGGKYNQNFVTTDEFQRILESLYASNYVLVDFDSFVETSVGLDGAETFTIKPILLPEDKKPVMLTETLVNYYDYMVDGNKDGKPDAQGAGFANKLVVDTNGDIKAEMVDKDGNTVVGDFDLIPILETFLKAHPDFSYRGSRAIIAPSGEQGIFGYRIQTSVISDPKFGQAYYDEQVQGAKEIVRVLREKGYTLACYTYGNANYGQINANQIAEDLQNWFSQINPIIGDTNVMVFAQGTDIGDYTGPKYKVLYDKGFRFFIGKADKPLVDVTNSYVHQKRLMVTGSNMFWNAKMFTGMFDCNAILNSMRGDVPKAK